MELVLDPSVGAGALLRPLLARLKAHDSRLFCIDSDPQAIAITKAVVSPILRDKVRYVRADFLKWSERNQTLFDCVVMNPPFAARGADLMRIGFSKSIEKLIGKERAMPLEATFICRCIDLLRDNGRLLAVLPSSLIRSESTQWLRSLLLKMGAIRLIHELSPRTFPAVESRIYLLVFDKSAVQQKRIILLNHDLAKPERLDVHVKEKEMVCRFDFGYHYAMRQLGILTRNDLDWTELKSFATVIRGTIPSPIGEKAVVHTTDFKDGHWINSKQSGAVASGNLRNRIQKSDLLMVRVGRDCHQKIGYPLFLTGLQCSDCVLIIRLKDYRNTFPLLFSLKVLFSLEWTKSLIERGTGATYVSHSGLLALSVPLKLHLSVPDFYASFIAAYHNGSWTQAAKAIELASSFLVS